LCGFVWAFVSAFQPKVLTVLYNRAWILELNRNGIITSSALVLSWPG
jgi:hypothetical protein